MLKIRAKCISIVFFILILRGGISGQESSYRSFYQRNLSLINPAAFPREFSELSMMTQHINANFRKQAFGIKDVEGAPRYIDARYEGVFSTKKYKQSDEGLTLKVGGMIKQESAGAIKNLNLQFNNAWLFHIAGDHSFSVGYGLDYNNQNINTNAVSWQTQARLPDRIQHSYGKINIGAFYYWRVGGSFKNRNVAHAAKNLPSLIYGYAGISYEKLGLLNLDNTNGINPANQFNLIGVLALRRFEPSIWVRYVPLVNYQSLIGYSPFSVDMNVRYTRSNNKSKNNQKVGEALWVGTGFSTAGTMNVEIGGRHWFQLNNGKGRRNSSYVQMSFAYTGLRLSTDAIRPADFELNLGLIFF